MLTHTPWRRMSAPHNIYGSAKELARPVARGDLSLTEADAGLIVATLREERRGELEGYKAADVVRLKRHLLRQYLHREEVARELAEHRIKRLVAPMIATRVRSNTVLAEAHGLNGQAGFPLTEDEVTGIVRQEAWFALPPAPGGRRHVG